MALTKTDLKMIKKDRQEDLKPVWTEINFLKVETILIRKDMREMEDRIMSKVALKDDLAEVKDIVIKTNQFLMTELPVTTKIAVKLPVLKSGASRSFAR